MELHVWMSRIYDDSVLSGLRAWILSNWYEVFSAIANTKNEIGTLVRSYRDSGLNDRIYVKVSDAFSDAGLIDSIWDTEAVWPDASNDSIKSNFEFDNDLMIDLADLYRDSVYRNDRDTSWLVVDAVETANFKLRESWRQLMPSDSLTDMNEALLDCPSLIRRYLDVE